MVYFLEKKKKKVFVKALINKKEKKKKTIIKTNLFIINKINNIKFKIIHLLFIY